MFTSHIKLSIFRPIQNGLIALVATLTFFSVTHLTIVLNAYDLVTDEVGAVIVLSILLNFYILWVIFDLIIMVNAMRYVFSPQVSKTIIFFYSKYV